jgi:hypothetical protein
MNGTKEKILLSVLDFILYISMWLFNFQGSSHFKPDKAHFIRWGSIVKLSPWYMIKQKEEV